MIEEINLRLLRIFKICWSIGVLCPLSLVHAQSTIVVVQHGDDAPDGDGTFSGFANPTLNNVGQAAFIATLTDTSSTNTLGIFRGDGVTALAQIVRKDQPAPDANGTFLNFSNPTLNDAGQAAFRAALTGTSGGSNDDGGIFRGDGQSASLAQIAREGEGAPDGNGTFSFFNVPALNNAGQVAFFAELSGTSGGIADDFGMYRGTGATGPTQIVSEGENTPDNNGKFLNFGTVANNLGNPVFNSAGQAAFFANLTGTSAPGTDNEAIFRDDGVNGLTQIVRKGQGAPNGAGTFFNLRNPALNDAGEVAFRALLSGTSGGFSDDEGIFLGGGQTAGLSQIAREGDDAPDGDGKFSKLFDPVINNAGQLAFGANLTGTNDGNTNHGGIFRGDGITELTQIARTGQAAPDGDGTFTLFESPVINDAGQVAFLAYLTGTQNGSGIFFYDDALGLIQVARRGSTIFGSPITLLEFNNSVGNGGDEQSGLNDLGQVAYAFTLSASNSSGIAIWSVPEPSTAALLALAGLGLALLRYRRSGNNSHSKILDNR